MRAVRRACKGKKMITRPKKLENRCKKGAKKNFREIVGNFEAIIASQLKHAARKQILNTYPSHPSFFQTSWTRPCHSRSRAPAQLQLPNEPAAFGSSHEPYASERERPRLRSLSTTKTMSQLIKPAAPMQAPTS